MIFAEVSLSTEGAVAVGALLAALAGSVVALFWLIVGSHKERVAELVKERAEYRDLAHEAVAALEQQTGGSVEMCGPTDVDTVRKRLNAATGGK